MWVGKEALKGDLCKSYLFILVDMQKKEWQIADRKKIKECKEKKKSSLAKVKAELGSGEAAFCGNRKISQLFPTDSAVQMKACPRLKIKGTNWLATEWWQRQRFSMQSRKKYWWWEGGQRNWSVKNLTITEGPSMWVAVIFGWLMKPLKRGLHARARWTWGKKEGRTDTQQLQSSVVRCKYIKNI